MSASNTAWLQQLGPGSTFRELALLPQVLGTLRSIAERSTPALDWSDALKVLVSAADAGTCPDGVDPTDWPALLEEWNALKSKVQGALPDALRPLTYKLSDLVGKTMKDSAEPGLLSFPLSTGSSASGTSSIGGLSFATNAEVGASGGIDFQVYDVAPAWATSAGYVQPAAECLVRFGVHGQLFASAGAGAKPVWGSVSATASASALASLDYCFNFPASRYVAQVLIDSIPEMASPGDLDGVLKACRAGGDFGMTATELRGNLKLGGDVGIGYSWDVASVGGAAASVVDVGAQVALRAGFTWAINEDYRAVVLAAGPCAVLRIERVLNDRTASSISLTAEIDVKGLQAALTPIVDKALPSSAALTGKLDQLLDIQGLALQAVSSALKIDGTGRWDDVAALILKENLAPATDRAAATAALSSVLSDRFDALGKAWLGGATTSIDSVEKQINDAVAGLVGGHAPSDGASRAIASAFAAVETAIDRAYAKFTAAAGDAIDGIAKALALTPTVVGDELKKARDQATTLTKPLVDWIASYERLRTKLAAAIAQAQKQKLAIAWGHTYTRDSTRTTIVEVRFSTATDASRALFGEMRAGRLGNYAALVDTCTQEGSAAQTQWLLTDVLQRTATDSLTFNFFGLLSTAATITAIDSIAVSAGPDGRVTAASDSISLSSALNSNGRLARASIDINLQMLAVGAPPPLSSTLSASGEQFTPKNEADFFGLLAKAAAVAPDAAANVKQLLWTGSASSAATLTNAELSVFFAPDLAGWERLLATDPADLLLAVRAKCIELLGFALELGDETGVPDGSPAAWIQDWKRTTRLSDDDFWGIAGDSTWRAAYEGFVQRGLGGAISDDLLANGPLRRGIQKIWQIQRISLGVRDAWSSLRQVNDLLATLRSGADAGGEASVKRQLSALSDRVRRNLADVFTGVYVDSGKPTRVSWQFLALIMTLSDIACAGVPTPLLTSVKARVGNADVNFLVV